MAFKFSELEKKLMGMYNARINENYCQECYEIDLKLNKDDKRVPPHAYWQLGKKYLQNKKRIAFSGKTSWIKNVDLKEELKIGSVYRLWNADYYFDEYGDPDRRYWDAIKKITIGVYNLPDNNIEFLDRIFVTNLVKCNVERKEVKSKNVTRIGYFKNCIDVFEKEIKIVKPTHVILFIGKKYDKILDSVTFGYDCYNIEDVTDGNHTVTINDSDAWWWHRTYSVDGIIDMNLLRIRHPDRTSNKFYSEWIPKIIDWVKNAN